MSVSIENRKLLLPAFIIKRTIDVNSNQKPNGHFELVILKRPVKVNLIKMEGENLFTYKPSIRQKRFVSQCHFVVKQNPVKYSETVIIKLGSSKKKYFESIYYECKLVPGRWTESMFVNLSYDETPAPMTETSEIDFPVDCYHPLDQPDVHSNSETNGEIHFN